MTDARGSVTAAEKRTPLVEVRDLVKHFPIKTGVIFDNEVGRVRAVDGVSLNVQEGETLGLVGESGSGKSTLGRTILQLIPPTSGSVRFEGQEIVGRRGRAMQSVRREMQMIFQDPYASLNPRQRVGQIVGTPLKIHGLASGDSLQELHHVGQPFGMNSVLRFFHEDDFRWGGMICKCYEEQYKSNARRRLVRGTAGTPLPGRARRSTAAPSHPVRLR